MADREKSTYRILSLTLKNSQTFTESYRFIACRSINLWSAFLQNNLPHSDNLIIKPRIILISILDNLVTALSPFFHRDHYFLSETD